MSFYMQDNGWKFIAGIIAGSPEKIDGMYAEYSSGSLNAGARSRDTYADMPEGSGYIRLRITNTYVDEDAVIHFTAYLTAADIPGDVPAGACIRCATLVSLDNVSADNDKLICTVDISSPIALNHSEYIVIHAGLKLGESR